MIKNNLYKREFVINNKKDRFRINDEITSEFIILIGEDGQVSGTLSKNDAIKIANDKDLDLVQMEQGSEYPVCKIIDYKKYAFELSKKKKRSKKQPQMKEIKLRPVTEAADYKVKLKSIHKFILSGDKVKVTIVFKGRELSFSDLGMKVMKDIISDSSSVIKKIEQEPKLEGRQIIMILS